jgi:hypothetical protein
MYSLKKHALNGILYTHTYTKIISLLHSYNLMQNIKLQILNEIKKLYLYIYLLI